MKLLLCQSNVYAPTLGGSIRGNRELLRHLAARGHECHAAVPATARSVLPSNDEFRAWMTARQAAVRRTIPGMDGFELEGVRIHAAADVFELKGRLGHLIEALEPAWILVQDETPGQSLLEEALKHAAPRVIGVVRTISRLPFGPDSACATPKAAALFTRVERIVCTSRFAEEYLLQWGPLGSAVAPRIARWPLPVLTMDEGPYPQFGDFDRGYITMINPCAVKGITVFLDLARFFPKIEFAAVPTWGTTREDHCALRSLPNVTLLPFSENIDDILGRTRVLLVPSLWPETFGRAVVEAMLRGIPVLASDTGGLPEAKCGVDYLLPVRAITGYQARSDDRHNPIPSAPPQELGPWSDALDRLLSDRARYEDLSEASRTAATQLVSKSRITHFEDWLLNLRHDSNPAREVSAMNSSNPGPPAGTMADRLASLTPAKRALLVSLLNDRLEKQTAGANNTGTLVAIQSRGSRPRLFVFHGHNGRIHMYRPLAELLGPDQPVFALQSRSMTEAARPGRSLSESARTYLDQIRSVQPEGPYHLIGQCSGGLLAYETACQLKTLGQPPGLLVLIDTTAPSQSIYHPDVGPWRRRAIKCGRILTTHAGAMRLLEGRARIDYLRLALKSTIKRALQKTSPTGGWRIPKMIGAPAAPPQPLLRPSFNHTERALLQANANYRPPAYSGRVVLIQAKPTFGSFTVRSLGWDKESIGELVVHVLPVSVGHLLQEPRIRFVADVLTRYLADLP